MRGIIGMQGIRVGMWGVKMKMMGIRRINWECGESE